MIVDGTQGKSHAAERGPIERLREERQRVVKEIAPKDPEQAQALEALAEAVDDRLDNTPEDLLAKEVERTESGRIAVPVGLSMRDVEGPPEVVRSRPGP